MREILGVFVIGVGLFVVALGLIMYLGSKATRPRYAVIYGNPASEQVELWVRSKREARERALSLIEAGFTARVVNMRTGRGVRVA